MKENEVKDSVAPCTMPTELFEKGANLYTDKTLVECELPELIVCYKNRTYHVVKDICIDDGLPSENKILIDNVKDDYKDGIKSPSQEECDVGTAIESGNTDKVVDDLKIQDELKFSSEDDIDHEYGRGDGLKSSLESDSDLDEFNECGHEDSLKKDVENCNATYKMMNASPRVEFVSKSVLSVDELCEQSSLKSLLKSSDQGSDDVGQQSDQISCVEVIPKQLVREPSAEESNQSDPTNKLSYDSKLESGTITFNFGACKTSGSIGDESHGNICKQHPESKNIPILEDETSDKRSVTSQFQHGGGESSFSLAEPVSGQITYSGPITYSASTSLRSDSSTTSTRSFAFPVLQAEWNSSPVRMAKADRRHLRRHKGWRMGLLCCRF